MKEKVIVTAVVLAGAIMGIYAVNLQAEYTQAHDYDHNKELCLSVGGKLMLSREFGRMSTYCEITPHEI